MPFDHRLQHHVNRLSRFAAFFATALGFVYFFFGTGLSVAADDSAKFAEYDVVVYGGTSGGVIAAVQTARMGKSVVLIEPGRHLGGLTSGGLGATDIGNKAAIGGLSRGFYHRVGEHYADDANWTRQTLASFQGRRRNPGEKEFWTFEPHVAELVYREMVAEAKVPVRFGERLDLTNGVEMNDGRIASIVMEGGRRYRGRMFIDATYEGDLTAKAGASYFVGREANSVYDETLNGVQPALNVKNHRFIVPVDPYLTAGDASSGLLPGIRKSPLPAPGTGDKGVQAYCFRMCTTDVKENQREWVKPADYDPQSYELLLRNCEAGDHRVPWNPIWMPNRKTDTNNNHAVSTDFIGANYDWAEGDYATRDRIFKAHLSYQQGLMWTLANHPRVPEKVGDEFNRLKPAKDEFVETDGWPHQLYVREARRLVSEYVMTQHDCQGRRESEDAVGLAAYTMDSHNVQRYVNEDGRVQNEGDVQVGGFSPYPIAYRAIRPKKEECENLLVPVCLSASHIAYGSIRMEPVFMVLGQSAATAACLALDADVAVQDVEYAALKKRLLADGQILAWTGPKRKPPVDPRSLPGIVLDNRDAKLTGAWQTSSSSPGYVGVEYLHDGDMGKGRLKAEFRPDLPKAGRYEVRIAWTANPNRATNVPVTIEDAKGEKTVQVNQRKSPGREGFFSLGRFDFDAGKTGGVTISNMKTDGHVIVDSVQWLQVEKDGDQ